MHLVEVGWGDVNWIGLAQDRDRYIESSCEFDIEPSGFWLVHTKLTPWR
jgi:hypothetical protein